MRRLWNALLTIAYGTLAFWLLMAVPLFRDLVNAYLTLIWAAATST